MNVVDYVIIGVIGLSVLFGIYRGFVASVLNMGGCLISFGLSFWLYPKVAGLIQNNQELTRTLMHYTDASSRIGDLELAISNVSQLTQTKITEILSKVNLPAPLNTLLEVNLENQVWAQAGISTVSDYVSQTILTAASLSYVGLGVQPPTPEWGAMLSAGRAYIRSYPHLIMFPGIFIMITVLGLNLFGDGLRDALDPKLKK